MEKVRIFARTESTTLPEDQRTRAGLLFKAFGFPERLAAGTALAVRNLLWPLITKPCVCLQCFIGEGNRLKKFTKVIGVDGHS